ncbi:CoA transferase [Bosea sp. (in: a-proteobacteria)]|jgi:crotonobetainyl-CoA:carnitine CoA-transferase CaiB-like acyl-CoA transferase|uniref:CaiB/BaiF CoA transferase family protein n=1 Tax=Bosea sp. (in: a-proteobacteria) TaxID=1871050 RepID=UPI001AC93F93|nr:CoA transferase [Bosea sp. (in: a-proteobacteria)]MBN9437175.1 CoA transferase [Bosea sp. (in: a-proteobacteria)]
MSNRLPPLSGMKVLDLSQIMAGPYCTMVLADLGAEVIKVEKPVTGDDSREMGPYVNGESSCFAHINRNKQGVSLNLKDPETREILYDMVRWADVVVENYRVGVTKSLGVDYETLSAINPRLIYCSISGYGQTGPYSRKGGFDLVAQGLTGIMSMTGEPGGRPLKSGIAIYDVGAGLTAAYSIMAAYVHQIRSGEGQQIDISLAECGLPWFVWEAAAYFAEGTVAQPTGSRHRVSAPYQALRTGDGFIVIGAANQRTWEKLCRDVIGRPDLIDDPRFLTNMDRMTNIEALEPLLEEAFASADAATWIARCEAASVPCGPINDFGDAMNDPHYLARGMVEQIEHPKLGAMKMIGIPTKFSKTPGAIRKAAPLLGEDTDLVLRNFGVPEDQIASLRARGAVQ